jgi:hypothetical protein
MGEIPMARVCERGLALVLLEPVIEVFEPIREADTESTPPLWSFLRQLVRKISMTWPVP